MPLGDASPHVWCASRQSKMGPCLSPLVAPLAIPSRRLPWSPYPSWVGVLGTEYSLCGALAASGGACDAAWPGSPQHAVCSWGGPSFRTCPILAGCASLCGDDGSVCVDGWRPSACCGCCPPLPVDCRVCWTPLVIIRGAGCHALYLGFCSHLLLVLVSVWSCSTWGMSGCTDVAGCV